MNFREAQQSLENFIRQLVIDTPRGMARLGDVLADFQREFFAAISPALQQLIGRNVPCRWKRFYQEAPRGHSKSMNLAIVVVWLLIASRHKVSGVGAAADKDQAKLLRDAIADLVRWNPALEHVLEVQAFRVLNKHTGSEFDIISSDARTSYGQRRSFIVCDELVHWENSELWHSLLSTAAKNPRCILACITNAGWRDSEWWPIRENLRDDSRWWFNRLDGVCAPWLAADDLDEQRRHLPDRVWRRLWCNEWLEGTGSSALESHDIQAAVTLRSAPGGRERGRVYVAGLDLGLKRDHSALVVLAKHVGYSERIAKPLPTYSGTTRALIDLDILDAPAEQVSYRNHPGSGRLELVAVRSWNPQAGRIEIEAIEREILTLHERFGLSRLSFDVWQGEFLGQRLYKAGLSVDPVTFTPKLLQEVASATLDQFRERQIDLFPHDALLNDLRALQVVEKSYGYRLQSPRDDAGHGDIASALGLCLLAAREVRSPFTMAQRQLVFN